MTDESILTVMHNGREDDNTVVSPVEKTSGKTTHETTQEKISSLLKHKPEITRNEIAEIIGISPDGVKYHLNELRRSGRIMHVGATKEGYWKIIEEKDNK